MYGWWILFFFFKQKTAYELRISDWSSDVCSSDLSRGDGRRDRAANGSARGPRGAVPDHRSDPGRPGQRRESGAARVRGDGGGGAHRHPREQRRPEQAREDVVWGKSEPVRGKIGGRRINKKKTQPQQRSLIH